MPYGARSGRVMPGEPVPPLFEIGDVRFAMNGRDLIGPITLTILTGALIGLADPSAATA
ncbi:hypothetical protein [Ancylobacter pratisalsi]|uniref:Uncharacterized protein n=1 Tax=Ancylobacter pratisalsi TaxID=1745854 RepID=A0A6P1YN98_9HYPH|nr:hypothetical protein [Ancylobacter pratisalsi]QIB34176.1 hypothetical protein G3A50_10995 [Ancylobacter pratisalsi]